MGTQFASRALAARAESEVFFENHCYDCHSGKKPKGGLDLKAAPRDLSDPVSLQRWVRIHDRIARGEMPPPDADQPPVAETDAFVRKLEEELLAADTARIAKNGRARMRRLTAVEYENTLRDVLGLERLDVRELLPPDGSVAGYTKIAEGLDLSPVYLAAYTAAAERAVTAAIATRSNPPPSFSRRIYPATAGDIFGNLIDLRAVLLRGREPDPVFLLDAPVKPPGLKSTEWDRWRETSRQERTRMLQQLGINKSEGSVGLLGHGAYGIGGSAALCVAPIYPGLYKLRMSLWSFHWNKERIEPAPAAQALAIWGGENTQLTSGSRHLATFTAPSFKPTVQEVTLWLDPQEALVADPVSLNSYQLHNHLQSGGTVRNYVGPSIAIDWFEFEGPLLPSWPPESHRRLFGDLPFAPPAKNSQAIPPSRSKGNRQLLYCLPALLPAERTPPLETVQSTSPESDARRLLSAFLPRAFRRPIAPREAEPYVALVMRRLEAHDCFEDAMARAYVAVLTSAGFLFHPADEPRNPLTLANRLAYWLWNSPPDAILLAAAENGLLATRAGLHAQVERLLNDPKCERFITDFANQWLELRRINETKPDRQLYPEYGFLLHEGVIAEPRAFLGELIRHDLPVTSLVSADFAMLNQRLAEHYGISGVEGVEVRRVPLPPNSVRGGLLGQAAIHKLTANGTTPSPVKRGVWLTDRLLNDPAPPPPPGVSAVDPDTRGATTIREQLDKHRQNKSCALCHAKIDPAGFALEAFDPIGGLRERYRSTGKGDQPPELGKTPWRVTYRLGPKVDPSGELRDGHKFTGPRELAKLLTAEPETLARAFIAHLSRYATGSDLTYSDRREIERIVESTKANGYGLRSLIHALAGSPIFYKAAP